MEPFSVVLYSVIAYSVSRRTHEIGVRMALGAERRDVLLLVLRDSVVLIGAGVAAGVATALALTRVVSGMLFGVSATNPAIFAVAGLFLAVVGVTASYLPARRAVRVEPNVALRYA